MIEMEKTWVNISDVLFFQEGPGVRNTQYTTSGVKLLNVANLVDGKVDLSTSDRYISEDEAYGKYSHFLCDVGDFIVASSGIKVEYIDKKMGFIEESMLPLCMNTSTIRFKVLDEKQLRIRYFMYYLKSQHFKGQLAREITGSAQLNYGPSHLKKMVMPLVDISIQDEIVQQMDKVQKIIDMRQMELSHLDDLIKARFVEMFGDVKTNVFGWERCSFDDVTTKITDGEHGTVPRVEEGEGYLYFMARNITKDGLIDLSETSYVPEEVHQKIYKRCNPEINDILLVCVGATIGKSTLVTEELGEFSMARSVALLKPDFEKVNSIFLINLLKSDAIQNDISNCAHAAAQAGLYTNMIKSLDAFLPPMELQNQFADFVKQVDKSKLHDTKTQLYLQDYLKEMMIIRHCLSH